MRFRRKKMRLWSVDYFCAYDGGGYEEWTQYYRTQFGARVSIFWNLNIASWGGTADLFRDHRKVEEY